MEICKYNKLKIVRKVEHGVYLADENEESVLLQRKEVPKDVEIGDELEVFIYLDSSDRKIATLKKPYITLGEIKKLKIVQITKIGIFLDWGLEKDLLLPFKEQLTQFSTDNKKMNVSDEIPVYLYIDRSGRIAATQKVYNHLSVGGNYVKDSGVFGTVIQINNELGVFVAIDNKYFGMIPIREVHSPLKLGDEIVGRVSLVREDGKYMISQNPKSHIQVDTDARLILKELEEADGVLYFSDKSDAEKIKEKFKMSKASFKKAIGKLYKERKISIFDDKIQIN